MQKSLLLFIMDRSFPKAHTVEVMGGQNPESFCTKMFSFSFKSKANMRLQQSELTK